jgi:PadR family transcriptional regulator PadR
MSKGSEGGSPVTARAALLQALCSGPGFGLELIDRVEQRTDGRVKLGQGSIYPALRAMEREGLLESYECAEASAERGGRPRRYYRLTAEGQRAAREDLEVFSGFVAGWQLSSEAGR